MNTLVIVLIAAVILFGAYVVYGRWLANKWGIDPKAETPAVKYNDGKDFVPTNGWTVFSHQFSSIAGAGPVTGAIQAAAFGWLPVLLWILIGGVFFGAVTDFGALYASVKNEGKSMGMIIEKYIGKFGRKIFLLFCWLFTLIVIAAFADMVAGTFNAYTVVDGQSQLSAAASTNGSAGMDLYACIDEKITINQYYSCAAICKHIHSSSTGRKKSRYHLVLSTWMGIWNKGRFQYWWDFTITSTKRNP